MSKPSKTRTKTGCITCKIRRVKCDETRPQCLRCLKQKRTCDGYPSPSGPLLSRRALALAVRTHGGPGPASRILSGPRTPDETTCFDFFRHRTAPMTGSFFPSDDFWNGRILQVAHVEPAVWHAAVALGALHRRWELGVVPFPAGTGDGLRFSDRAAKSYARAMALAREISDPLVLLVLSLGLTAVTNIMGRWVDNRVHIKAGRKLLDELKVEKAARRGNGRLDGEIESVAESFVRMDMQAIAFSEAGAPYPDPEGPETETDLMIGAACAPKDVMQPGDSFQNLGEAGFRLFDLNRRFLILGGMEEKLGPGEMLRAEEDIKDQIMLWEHCMMDFLESRAGAAAAADEKNKSAILSLKLYHAMLRLVLVAAMWGAQTDWDSWLAHYERIIATAELLMEVRARTQSAASVFVTLEPGVVIPLYLAATRCRHPILRRRALELLQKANCQEGRWHSIGAFAVAEKIMEIEEGVAFGECCRSRLRSVGSTEDVAFEKWAKCGLVAQKPEDWLMGDENWRAIHSWEGILRIPEPERVLMTSIHADSDKAEITINLFFSGPDQNGNLRSCSEVIDLSTPLRGYGDEVCVQSY